MSKVSSISCIILCIFVTSCASMEEDWEKAKRDHNAFVYSQFLQKYPNSEYAAEARRARESSLWDVASGNFTSNNPSEKLENQNWALGYYIEQYPNGLHAIEAKNIYDPIAFKKAKAQGTIEAIESYLNNYPDGSFVSEAKESLSEVTIVYNKLSQSNTSEKLQDLIDDYSEYHYCYRAIPKLERTILEEYRSNKFKNCTVLPLKVYLNCLVKVTLEGTLHQGNQGYISAGAEFPGDTDGLNATLYGPNYGDGSILRFTGTAIKINDYIFEGDGDELNRLTFYVIKDLGYVYLRGKGNVTTPKGEIKALGY